MRVHADAQAILEGVGVVEAEVRLLTGSRDARETCVEAIDNFVAVDGVSEALDARECVDGFVGLRAIGVAAGHLFTVDEGGVVGWRGLEVGCAGA